MLTDRFSHTSWIIRLTTRVDPTIGVGACSSISPGGVQGGWPLNRMLAMSPNPGGGAHGSTMGPSVDVSTLGLEVAMGLESWVVIGEPGADSLGSPLSWSCSAQRWALLGLQWLWLQQWHCSSPRLWGGCCPGRDDLCPTQGHGSHIFLCFPCFCNFFCFHNFGCFHNFHYFHNFHWRCWWSNGSQEFPCTLFQSWQTCRGLFSRHCMLEGFSQGSGQHRGLGNWTNTRPWSSSTVGHWKRPPRVDSKAHGMVSLLSTSEPWKVISGSMACFNSSTIPASWWGLPGISGFALFTQYWSALVYAKVFFGCPWW